MKEINEFRRYWDKIPESFDADYIFRIFEPNGVESFSCGNGLMCMANYLYHQHGIESARILTEIPRLSPKVISFGTDLKKEKNWANIGHPRRISAEIADKSIRIPYDDDIDIIKDITIDNFRKTDGLRFFTNQSSLKISGWLISSGEPHFVIFVDKGFSLKHLSNQIFNLSFQNKPRIENFERRDSSGISLVRFIGNYFVREYSHLFPSGINIDFVRVVENSGILEYRCFERGVNRETLACGTGAVASAFIAKRLKLIEANQIFVQPHRCRWYDTEAQFIVKEGEIGWLLYGNPIMLFEGVFIFNRSIKNKKIPLNFENFIGNRNIKPIEDISYQINN